MSTSPKLESLRDLYILELRDLYNAENQLVKALPKMAKAASEPKLQKAFESHLEETKGHVERLEQILDALGEKPTGETCHAMKGLVEEGGEFIKAKGNESVIDAGLIGAAQRVEHYEIAGYGTARALAEHLGEDEAVDLLQQTLDEEAAADKKLTEIAESSIGAHATSPE